MIYASVPLIAVAVVLLVLGLIDGSSALLISSIAVSLLAAVALVIGARQAPAARAEGEPLDAELEPELDGDEMTEEVNAYARAERAAARDAVREATRETAEPFGRAGEPAVALAEPATATVPAQGAYAAGPRHGPDPVGSELGPQWREPDPPATDDTDAEYDEEDPPDEPAPQSVSPADAARVARLSTEVLVIDGRPRYHLPGCVHLLGRENEPLPVSEAVELGFTPCSLCEPDNALLADARRG